MNAGKRRKKRRDLVRQTLNFEHPSRIPRQMWPVWPEGYLNSLKRKPLWRKLRRCFPDDLIFCPAFGLLPAEKRLKKGELIYADEWGCLFRKIPGSLRGQLISPPIKNWEDLENWREPVARLNLDKERVNDFCRSTDRFVLASSWISLFERLQLLRGPEKLFSDLRQRPPEFFYLLRRLHEFLIKELEIWAETRVDGLCLMDDWGGERGLLVSPELFRSLFKPLYSEYASIARKYKKFIFFHSDGYILDLLPDLIEIGISAINCQLFLMGVKPLSSFRGQVTFWGSSDLAIYLGHARKREIQAWGEQIFSSLWERGGFIAQAEVSPQLQLPALRAYFSFWKSLTKL